MGRDISRCDFSDEDFVEFKRCLVDETRLLTQWIRGEKFSGESMCGFELEAWLVDSDYQPAPINDRFLDRLNHPLIVPELSKFNFEINSTPQRLTDDVFHQLASELYEVWGKCEKNAQALGSHILAVGILPTISNSALTLENMTDIRRYHALNDQVLRMRKGQPLDLNIEGRDVLNVQHEDVMLEAVATSLQIHLQVKPKEAVRHYNASQILSAPMVALAANSPYLFGKDLWDETRIPTFEQSVSVASFRDSEGNQVGRVTFGTGYARESILEPFLENLNGYPILLPLVFDEDPGWLSHLRLHNGTVWRWTRPLIGIGSDGTPHIRMEHRVPAAGPTPQDVIANIAFFLGLMLFYTRRPNPLETEIPFHEAKANFYEAARHGLQAKVTWEGGKVCDLQTLLQEKLVPAARKGLLEEGVREAEVAYYIDEIIFNRVKSGQNGSAWQRAYYAAHGADSQKMTHAYHQNQKLDIPVHEWKV